MLAPSVSVELRPSRVACIGIMVLMIGAIAALVSASMGALYVSIGTAVVIGWAIDRLRVVGQRRGPRAVRAVLVRGDDTIQVIHADRRMVEGRVQTCSTVSAYVTTIVWKPRGGWISRGILIVPDMLPDDAFRRLRVLMRYGSSEDAEGLPESHA